jgi:hypothetical protein
VTPAPTETVLAQLTAASLGHNVVFYGVQLITTVLLGLAANTSFGGLPVLASLLAKDNFLPHLFRLRAAHQVHRYGVSVLAVAAAILLVVARGDTQALVPLFAIGVFVGFTLSQAGMVRHWHSESGPGWLRHAVVNGVGAVATTAALAIELGSKFVHGAVQPSHPWWRILHNQRGFVLDRAIQRGTANVVICRLRYRLETLSPPDGGSPADQG